MHLLVDGQCLQTDSVQRGIGRYSLRLLQALHEADPSLQMTILLNRVAEARWTDAALRGLGEAFSGTAAIEFFETPPARMIQFRGARAVAEQCREDRIRDIGPDVVLILSAFQRQRETILAPRGSRDIPTAAILYDLIPLHYPDYFLYAPSLKASYQQRLGVLQDCDLLLSISEASARDWRRRIGSTPAMATIGGGCEPPVEPQDRVPLIARRGVLAIGAETPNKNLEVLIDAYSQLPLEVQQSHPLTITGIRRPAYARYLMSRYSSTGGVMRVPDYLPQDALNRLLRSSRIVVSPSTVEGLGMAAYEAAPFGTPTLVSAHTSQSEFILDPRAQFHAHDVETLGSCVRSALTQDALWTSLEQGALNAAAVHPWVSVARRCRAAIGNLSVSHQDTNRE